MSAASLIRRLAASELAVLALCAAYFLALAPFAPGLGSRENLANVFSSLLPLLVAAIGQTFVLITGGIDLSVTSIIALTSVVGGSIMTADGGLLGGGVLAAPAGISAMLLLGLGLGLLNGLAVAFLAMPPFMVTLTAMMFLSGSAIWVTRSKNIDGLPAAFCTVGQGFLIAAAVAMGLAAVAHVILRHSLLGWWLHAIGRNRRTAEVSGVPIRRVVIFAYAASGLCAALASVLYTGRLETASPVHGQRIFLDVIGAAVIGGNSLFGGKGTVPGTMFGVLFITLIDNSLNLLGLSHFAISMVKGCVILAAAVLDVVRTRLSARGA